MTDKRTDGERTTEGAIEELENYLRDSDDHAICTACGGPMDAEHGMAAHDELCPLGIVVRRLREREGERIEGIIVEETVNMRGLLRVVFEPRDRDMADPLGYARAVLVLKTPEASDE